MQLDIYQVDAFTTEAFKGNPAAVCITRQSLDDLLMRSIAEEMAVSETAFLALDKMCLRWFTPEAEVDLCGHGTLAVAQVMLEEGLAFVDKSLVFHSRSGPLAVTVKATHIEMDFPAALLDDDLPDASCLYRGLGINPGQVRGVGGFDSKYLIEIDSEQSLLDLSPDFAALKQQVGRGVVVTAQSDIESVDIVSRYFAPWVGVNEDPVTGSAHCALAVYWQKKLGRSQFKAYQASRRGGYVEMTLAAEQRVKLRGNAVIVMKGTLYL